MKKIGLVGGTGPESTVIYYKKINERINKIHEGILFPELAIESVNLYKALELVGEKKYQELKNYLLKAVRDLENGGAEIVALTAGTMHVVYEELAKEAKVPLISIPETVAKVAFEKGYRKVGLLGTIFTMEQVFMKKDFWERGIDVVVPCEDDRLMIHEIIAGELEMGVVKEESVAKLVAIIEKLKKENGIQAIILGCTELPLALNSENCPVACLDIMDLHIDRLVELAR